jgi:hypothetical protein
MRYSFQNDLYYVLKELDGNYDLSEGEVEALARKLSLTRLEPMNELQRALRIERGEEEPDFNSLGDWQYYRTEEYTATFEGRHAFDNNEERLRRLLDTPALAISQTRS